MRNLVLCCCALAALAAPTVASAAGVTYCGSTTINDTILQGGAIKAFEARTGVKLTVTDLSGTGKGIKLAAAGQCDVAGAGRALSAEEKKAGMLGVIVGYDGLAVFVNKANPVKDLSKEQLKEIFTGKATHWKAVGGADAKVTFLVEPLASKRATVQMIQEQAMDGAPFGGTFREMDLLSDQLKEVARNPSSICVASIGLLSSASADVKAALHTVSLDATEPSDANIRSGAYLLSRPIVLVTRGLPQGDVKKFVDFMLSREGQGIVERYFVAMKK